MTAICPHCENRMAAPPTVPKWRELLCSAADPLSDCVQKTWGAYTLSSEAPLTGTKGPSTDGCEQKAVHPHTGTFGLRKEGNSDSCCSVADDMV